MRAMRKRNEMKERKELEKAKQRRSQRKLKRETWRREKKSYRTLRTFIKVHSSCDESYLLFQ